MDRKSGTTFIQVTDKTYRLLCVYWSSLSKKLLVGMQGEIKGTFKLTWYSQTGHFAKTVQFNNTEIKLCQYPRLITENNNGDIMVSGPCAVVVTDHGGRHRFSYTGHPLGSIFFPKGTCTDALSHILVCEKDTIQLIDVDGYFLSYLLIRPPGILYPYSLSYDAKSYRLCVAAWNRIFVYRYITRQDFFAGNVHTNVKESVHADLKLRRIIKKDDIIFTLEGDLNIEGSSPTFSDNINCIFDLVVTCTSLDTFLIKSKKSFIV